MGERNRVKYKVTLNTKDDIKEIYSFYRKSSPLEKMKILLKLLEKSFVKNKK